MRFPAAAFALIDAVWLQSSSKVQPAPL